MSKLDAKDLDLADRIRKVRRFKGFKESDMAERLGISQRQYGRYENGEQMIPPEKVGAICVILEVEETNLRNFDERMSFSHCNGNLGLNNNSTYNAPPERERELYEATIKLLQEEVAFLRKQLEVALLKEKTG
ncbi:MAG TPA: helix-turn-helix transcriptional regulator [Flavobacteriales bacterium]|nr:helix-turn-helix transcriptional regulator [Flavobacteriales bacterium]MBK6549719.1 helix-turn-helix transcriptional regulator [Flavobacteriales bacterium]MBK7112974.1 helix-turn-helix transcriptional regulator [Flavobacteriales bacterium]MBK7619208.1 helix-turn-helix transcriptional regulator [Flavobacteriales bacterium]MBK8533348.1 helix-turn-helix transcriptional regulator [Flavobacteriales bacterium]